ncbi:uncharacterized protein LOC131957979 [Physella acuta]|uniref:uncharacterized protein LOC131957979 n=1 Tax=Physella acuta TaxID=109671 RepID=UPI0027DBAF7A|nr:uncharacterized protein LOC131957979 [Physella acuta]
MYSKIIFVFISSCMYVSDSAINLIVNPPFIEIGFTNSFTVDCTVSGDSGSTGVYVDSIIISRTDENSTDTFREMASIQAFIGHVVELSSENATVSGAINGTHLSYLRLTWTNPSFDRAGLYRCEATGVDAIGHRYNFESVAKVTVETPDVELFVMEMQALMRSVALTENYQSLAENRLISLERAKLSIFDISTTYKDSTYYLSYGYEYVQSYQSQETCQLYGGYLAEMDNIEEMTFIRSYIRGLTSKPYRTTILIGGTNEGHVGTWKSTDNNLTIGYTAFGRGYPAYPDSYPCLFLYSSVDWMMINYPCITNLGFPRFLCEMPFIER